MAVERQPPLVILDDRAGFYMVPAAAIAKARTHLCGAQLAEALAGLACLARESFLQHGASRDALQSCEANLEELSGRILGVSRARALRILDNLVDAGALTKDAHRFDGTRRLPTKITFVDLAYAFAYVSAPAFRALRRDSRQGGAPFGALALYLTLVGLGGDQRAEFPDGDRRVARASQPELAKLSGLSVSSVKRATAALVAAGLVDELAQPANTLKTKTTYRLTDPADAVSAAAAPADRSQLDRRAAHSDTDDSSPPHRWAGHSPTDDRPAAHRRSAHSPTDDGSTADRPTGLSVTDGQARDPARAHVKLGQKNPEVQNQLLPVSADDTAGVGEGGEVILDEAGQLIDTFLAWTREALGDRRARELYDEPAWQQAATGLLEQYDLERLLAGIDRLRRDALLADKATTLPAFATIAERALARAAADRRLSAHRATPSGEDAATGSSWAAAQTLLRQAISAYGPKGEQRALAFLTERDPQLADFAADIGWRALTRSEESMTDIKFAYLTYAKRDRPEAA